MIRELGFAVSMDSFQANEVTAFDVNLEGLNFILVIFRQDFLE
jgi:hypothetical protein